MLLLPGPPPDCRTRLPLLGRISRPSRGPLFKKLLPAKASWTVSGGRKPDAGIALLWETSWRLAAGLTVYERGWWWVLLEVTVTVTLLFGPPTPLLESRVGPLSRPRSRSKVERSNFLFLGSILVRGLQRYLLISSNTNLQ